MWDRFSLGEMARRWALARDLMRRRDLGGLLVFGNSGVNRHNQANVFWLTNHVPNARQVSDVPIIEWGGYNPAEAVAARLQAVGLGGTKIGIVGVPYQHYDALRKALPDMEPVDVTAEFTRFREIKSAEEIAWLRRAAAFTDQTILALRDQVRPGIREYSLLGIIEGAFRSQGGQPHIAFLRSMAMNDPNGCLPAQNPSDRILRRGDVIITEISASHWGYSGQIHRPVFVGSDPTPPWSRMFDVARTAYDRMAEAIRPGATERDVIRAASVIGEHGYLIYDDLIHGYGVDILPPLIDRSCCRYWPWEEGGPAPEGRRFEQGMAVVIQPNPVTPDERMGLQLGALTVVPDSGAESLHAAPFEPVVATAA